MPIPFPASSFETGNAPGAPNYAAPLVNFSELAQLPDQFFKGTQNRRTLNLQNAFPKGLPQKQDADGNIIRDKDGNSQIDVNAVGDTLTKLGGAEYATQLLPYLYGDAGANVVKNINEGVDGPTSGAAPAQPTPAARPMSGRGDPSGPGSITGNRPPQSAGPTSSAAPAQPVLSSMGTDNNGADTVRTIMAEHAGGQDVSQIIPRVAAAFQVKPDDPLSPQQAQSIRARLQTTIAPQPQSSATTGGGAPVTPLGGTSGNGAPVPGGGPGAAETASPATGIVPQPQPAAQPVRVAQNQPGGGSPVPGVSMDQITAAENDPVSQRLIVGIGQAGQEAVRLGKFNPAGAQAVLKVMEGLQARLKARLDVAGKNAEQTPAFKDMQTGAAAYNAASDAAIKSGATKLAGVVGAANQYESDLKSKVELSQSLMNDPQMYTGTGGDLSLMLNKARAVAGDNRPAALQEMLSKVTAGSVLSQLNSMKDMMMQAGGASSSAGRIFQQYVELANKAAPQVATTLEGNRALIELERRNGEQALAIRDLSNDYLGPMDPNGVGMNHKFLDAGFDKVVSNYLKSHPMFTKEEMADPALVGAPTMPPVRDKAQGAAWIAGMGLKPGDPVRVNGQIKMVPRVTVPLNPANVRPRSAQAAPQQ